MATQTTRVVPKGAAMDLAALDTAVDALAGTDAVRQIGATDTVGGSATEINFGFCGVEVDCDDTVMTTHPAPLETSTHTVQIGTPDDADRDSLTDRPT